MDRPPSGAPRAQLPRPQALRRGSPKPWFIDRMVLLSGTMAERDPRYPSWEY
ncbi:hypothetical protein ACU610_16980 [Geodermatophilus sp. URMC 61]|uniref:hypothetical protein n=1 Tax=Geodermatophilus sp. URMC 61 TaxID=3423411 RepID=UPI00406C401A